jgi:hypothetical protein
MLVFEGIETETYHLYGPSSLCSAVHAWSKILPEFSFRICSPESVNFHAYATDYIFFQITLVRLGVIARKRWKNWSIFVFSLHQHSLLPILTVSLEIDATYIFTNS